MHLIADQPAEQSLGPLLLLLGSGGLPLVVAIGRARVTAALARLTRKQGSPAEGDMNQALDLRARGLDPGRGSSH